MSDEKAVIPTSYQEWRHCIEVDCGITLSPAYIGQRLAELEDGQHAKTKEYARLYGEDHLQRTQAWFRRAADELTGNSR